MNNHIEDAYSEIRLLRKQVMYNPNNSYIYQEIKIIEEWISKQMKNRFKQSFQ